MSRYDGLIIPRSYSEYINKTDAATLSQALALPGVMDAAPTESSNKAARSGGIFAANAVIMANNKTLSGVAISAGSVVRVLFTAALPGSDATTGLTLTYNGNTYAVKVGKNGALANFLANNIDGSYIYCQAYTTLELMFDGTQFIIMGNPVVISSADYTIYTDGTKTLASSATQKQLGIEMIEVHSGSSNKKYKIGYCQSSNNSQAFAILQIVGGRVDSIRGLRFLSLSNKTTVSGKAVFQSNNNSIYVYNVNNRLEVYANLETYCYLQFLAYNSRTPRFTFDVQEVNDFPSSDYRVFNNSFTEM